MRTLALLLALGLAACDTADAPPYPASARSGEVTLAIGQSASLDGLAVTFEAVRTDSRCPATVECVWEGEAIVALTLGGAAHDVRVADPEARPEDGVEVGAVVVFAAALTPEPRADAPVDVPHSVTLVSYPAP